MGRTIGRSGELDSEIAAIIVVDEADQRLADQILGRGAEEVAQGPIRLFQAPEAVDKRDTDRRVGEKALEALTRQAQRRFPFTLRRQVPDDRMGAQLVAIADDALADPGMDDAAVAALQHHFAALRVTGPAAERVARRGASGWRRGEELMQPRVTADQFRRGRAKPAGEGRVDEAESSLAIDRIKTDRRLVEKIDEPVALVADHPLHLVLSGDVLDVPEAIARSSGDRINGYVEPTGGGTTRIGEWQRGDGAPASHRLIAQTLKIDACFGPGNGPGQAVEHGAVIRGKKVVKSGVGIGDAAIRRDDELRVG